MNWLHIRGALRQEYYVTRHSLEILADVFLFPLTNIIIFGLIAVYLSGSEQVLAAKYMLLGMLFWQFVAIVAYSIAVGAMWNIWSHNLSNMFVAPLKVKEYVTALFASGALKAALVVVLGAILSALAFGFDVREVGYMNLFLVFILFSLFGFAIGVASLGLIFRFGTRLAALSWSLPWMFQPLSGAFFPFADLPYALKVVALLFPPTYGYEATRMTIAEGGIAWELYAYGFALALVYCVGAALAFRVLFRKSKDTGQFARNEA